MAEEILKEVQEGITGFFTDDGDKKDDALYSNKHPYANVEKAAVLQAARNFHDSTIVKENPKLCVTTITQLLHLQNSNTSSQRLLSVEATEVFFGVTKLFVSNDSSLRRMVYVFLKDVCHSCDPSDVIIVTSCLTKDMTCDVDLYRANALRVLVHIIDSAMLSAIERYIKQAIIHKSPIVSSSALVSSLHLFQSSPESASIVKRWVAEVTEAIKSPNDMVQFHATQLFYQMKAHDRLGVSKFVQKHANDSSKSPSISSSSNKNNSNNNNSLHSPLAIVCLIRYTFKLVQDEILSGRVDTSKSIQTTSQLCITGYQFLESSLRHESEMVSYEAAKAIASLPTTHPEDVHPALSVLQLLLSSPKPSARLGAVKTLGVLASAHPRLVSKLNENLEALVGDSNRLIGTLSIMTLLKTGNEESIDRLLKCIYSFLVYIPEEYKIMIVKSLENLCVLYPKKYIAVVAFMAKFLREEGAFKFKKTIVSSMIALMDEVEESKELTLIHLCEFIEDCEYVLLSTQVLHILGDLGPKTRRPARYVRFVYNRTILDNAMIRAAAVSALGKFGAECPSLRTSIIPLLRHCLQDEDDETRDRAILALTFLEMAEKENPYVALTPEEEEEANRVRGDSEHEASSEDDNNPAQFVLLTKLPFTFDNLESRLRAYKSTPSAMESLELLSFDMLPVVEEVSHADTRPTNDLTTSASNVSSSSFHLHTSTKFDQSAILHTIPEFAAFGQVFQSSPPVSLTESEAEYVVQCVKHIYEKHIVLQFIIENTIDDQRLKNVSVSIESDSEALECTGEIPAECIDYGACESCFSVFERDTSVPILTEVFACELKFSVSTIDPQTGEEEGGAELTDEEYTLENLEISIFDFVLKSQVPDFRRAWESLAGKHEILQKYCLPQKNLGDAVKTLIKCIGLQTMDGTSKARHGAKQHMLHLSGTCLGNTIVARAQVSKSSSGSMILKLALRSDDLTVAKAIADSIG